MADISKLARVIGGEVKNVDLSANTLLVTSIKVGAATPTELTKTILDRLVSLQNGTDVDATYHTHDGRYFTETELSDATGPATGSDLIGDDDTYSTATPTAATVKGALEGLDVEMANRIRKDGSVTFTADQPMGSFKLTGLSAGSAAGHSVRYEQAILTSGANAFAADQSMGGNKLTNVGAPVSATDAATKGYVDAVQQGLDVKQSVRVATTAAGTLATSFENLDTVDGVTLATGDRILIKDQAAGAENGIYVVNATGAPTRATDADISSEVTAGMFVFVEEGTANADSGWILTTNNPITLDTTALAFAQFSGAGSITAGAGLTKTGNTLDIGAGDGISVAADSVAVSVAALVGAGIEDDGSNNFRISAAAAGAGLTGGAGSALAVGAGDGITVNADDVAVNTTAIAGQGLENDGSNNLRISTAAAGAGLTGGAGSALTVAYSPMVQKSVLVGEAMAANTTFLVRYAVSGETAGRVYKADNDANVAAKNYYVIGIIMSTSALSIGDSVLMKMLGTHTLGSSDTAFGAGDIGVPVYLGTAGAFTVTAPSADLTAATKVGVVETTSTISFGNVQMMGIN